jgi:hypothetical protein
MNMWQISISLFVNATKDNCTEETALKEDKLSFFPALKKYRNPELVCLLVKHHIFLST